MCECVCHHFKNCIYQRETLWEKYARMKGLEEVPQPLREGDVMWSWSMVLRCSGPKEGESLCRKARVQGNCRDYTALPANHTAWQHTQRITHAMKRKQSTHQGACPSSRPCWPGTFSTLSLSYPLSPMSPLSHYSCHSRWMPFLRGGKAAPVEGRLGTVPAKSFWTWEQHSVFHANCKQNVSQHCWIHEHSCIGSLQGFV